MARLRAAFLLAAAVVSASASARPAEVVVVAFGKFADHATNSALPVGRAAAALLRANGVRVRFCEIPTSYARAFPAARECVEGAPLFGGPRPRPALVVGLGTGMWCSRMEIATVVENRIASDGADVDGRIIRESLVEPGGPDAIALPFDEKRLLSTMEKDDLGWLDRDATMGNYVCNQFTYRMARHFARDAAYAKSQFVFFHLPSESCGASLRDPGVWSPLIAKMALAAIGRPARAALKADFVPPKVVPVDLNLVRPRIDLSKTPELRLTRPRVRLIERE